MLTEELQERARLFYERCVGRLLVGADEYAFDGVQRFEGLDRAVLVRELDEELMDAANYLLFLSLRIRGLVEEKPDV